MRLVRMRGLCGRSVSGSVSSFTIEPSRWPLKHWLRVEFYVRLGRHAKLLQTTSASATADPNVFIADALPAVKFRFVFATD